MNYNSKHYMNNHQPQEEDNVPLAKYLLTPIEDTSNKKTMTVMKKRQQQGYFFQQPVITLNTFQQQPIVRRPSYPATPSSLLDSFSEDEDDEDLVPIAYISSIQKKKFQSVADKYKEKVKAQLDDNSINVIDDDDLPLSKSCFFN